ncbi:SWI/SNF complex subunit SWI3C isoform X1 [Lycium barbarum]|uniref:SWI/SNF complex subunit SWI3C isoform X1 n=1 Tax=Lycium barbarum TaxID=112863 RepID=UPI00293EDFD8|nr:SWI/SNF complex subunit SWI3C isoform X1 [Lycium barbarum]
MPASSSETRNRWRKRKREPLRKQKNQHQDDDVFEEDDDVEEDIDQQELIEDENPNNVDRSFNNNSVELVSEIRERISEFPVVVKRAVTRPHSSVASIVAIEKAGLSGETRQSNGGGVVLENVSYGQLQARSFVPVDCHALLTEESGGGGSYVITPPRILPGRGVVKRYGSAGRIHVVPMHADWFSPNTVHRLERQVVPHFFSGKSTEHTPEKYMECRNCIVAKYMESPVKHLSVADCHGIVAGVSADDVTRIARFLDHWGIINYCAAPPKGEAPKDGTYLYEDSNSDVCVPVAGLKSIDSLVQFDKPKCRLKAKDVYPELVRDCDDDSDFDNSIRELLSEIRCNCCSRPVSLAYYQSQKEIDILLCLDCFHEGRFVPGHSSLDFFKVSSMKDYGDLDGDTWTDQETLLLLEGMQLYNENWNQIAEHVGTKSKAQCILHFVRLPVDGAPLEKIELPGASGPSSSCTGEDRNQSYSILNGNLAGPSTENLDSDSKFPFENSGNPVMSLVAFLASAVGPRVAAACAHASLAALSKDDTLSASRNMTQMDGSTANNGTSVGRMPGKSGSPHGDVGNSHQLKDEKSGGQGPRGQQDAGGAPLSTESVRAAAKVGLAAAAIKSKLFADHEEREIQRLSANIINHQLKRLELKLKQFAEVETLLMKECEQLERTRQRFATERARMMTTQPGSVRVSRPMGVSGAGAAVVSNTSNSRQQVVSGPPQQNFISGYGNNQQMHPQMSFMPQQGMYGFGPRLPLSAIHPSSSTPGMFNAPTSSQPALSHSMLRPVSGTKSGLG